jgi:hypothetical protein
LRGQAFLGGEEDQVGRLAYRPDAGDEPWFFDYESDSTADDEVGHRFASTPFVNGQYVSIRDDEDEVHTFIVVAVDNAT